MLHARPDYNRIQDPANKIGEDEPVFLLRAKDKLAPDAVMYWADLLEDNDGDPELIKAARDHARLMVKWQSENTYKLPDYNPEKDKEDGTV
jgi:hypothetical protein